MSKASHEIRDPVHVFVRYDSYERDVLNSRPLQRLRHIHQLALTYLVYPGATHKRFEHSIGVMELAGRIYDVITSREHVTDEVRSLVPELKNQEAIQYWRRVVRMAALCHDIGHLPFSHAAEKDLLPDGWDHERFTKELILNSEITQILTNMIPPLKPEHVAKIAVGPEKAQDMHFTNWEAILSEIIVGDVFGADRMDYLLRDSLHTGVAYGRFDHYRLIDTLRILPSVSEEPGLDVEEPALGVEEGGLQTAESLLLARYLMYSQVYFHSVRRIYDIHLKDFLRSWLPNGKFPTDLKQHLAMTDNEVNSVLLSAAYDENANGHREAKRITGREHFRVLYSRSRPDILKNPEAAERVYQAAKEKFGDDYVRRDHYNKLGGNSYGFPVLLLDGSTADATYFSSVLGSIPIAKVDYVFISPEKRDTAVAWLKKYRQKIIEELPEEEGE